MQNENIQDELIISTCPKCGTRLMSGKLLVGGMLQCAKCKRHWMVEMDEDQVVVRKYSCAK
ncbi:MAG: hypothetical protein LUG54_03010 [Clostridiales bacterium]|nr:hypothetical protein [Clostridiales bacterium]